MATCTIACFAPTGIVLVDPANLLPTVTLKGPASTLNPGLGGLALTPGVDTNLWARWSAPYANGNLIPSAAFLASTP